MTSLTEQQQKMDRVSEKVYRILDNHTWVREPELVACDDGRFELFLHGENVDDVIFEIKEENIDNVLIN